MRTGKETSRCRAGVGIGETDYTCLQSRSATAVSVDGPGIQREALESAVGGAPRAEIHCPVEVDSRCAAERELLESRQLPQQLRREVQPLGCIAAARHIAEADTTRVQAHRRCSNGRTRLCRGVAAVEEQ